MQELTKVLSVVGNSFVGELKRPSSCFPDVESHGAKRKLRH